MLKNQKFSYSYLKFGPHSANEHGFNGLKCIHFNLKNFYRDMDLMIQWLFITVGI